MLNHPQFAQPEHDDRERGGRHDHGDALEPVVLVVRHGRAAGAARLQGEVLECMLILNRDPHPESLLLDRRKDSG